MSPLSLIPPQYQLVAIALLAVASFGAGWAVNGWRLGTKLASLQAEHAQTITAATQRTLAAQKKAQAAQEQLAGELAALSAVHLEDMTRRERAIQILRPDIAAGTRVVRVAGTCPPGPGDLPQAAGGGRVDPGAGAVLAPDAGQRVLDLRAGATRFDAKLAACQAAVIRLTGQPRAAAAAP